MEFLCRKFCPEYLEEKMQDLRERQKAAGIAPSEVEEAPQSSGGADEGDEEEEDEEEEEEEQELD
jgi:protein-ribulosamine 3-kinase